jgi:hypothetical protein
MGDGKHTSGKGQEYLVCQPRRIIGGVYYSKNERVKVAIHHFEATLTLDRVPSQMGKRGHYGVDTYERLGAEKELERCRAFKIG